MNLRQRRNLRIVQSLPLIEDLPYPAQRSIAMAAKLLTIDTERKIWKYPKFDLESVSDPMWNDNLNIVLQGYGSGQLAQWVEDDWEFHVIDVMDEVLGVDPYTFVRPFPYDYIRRFDYGIEWVCHMLYTFPQMYGYQYDIVDHISNSVCKDSGIPWADLRLINANMPAHVTRYISLVTERDAWGFYD